MIVITDIKSSVVKGIKYADKNLTVQLMDRIYTYQNVPKTVAIQFMASKSKGKFYNENIKEVYDTSDIHNLASSI